MILVCFNLVWSPHCTRADLSDQQNKEVTIRDFQGWVIKALQVLPGSLGSLALGKVSHQEARTIKQPCLVKPMWRETKTSYQQPKQTCQPRGRRRIPIAFSSPRQTLDNWSPSWHLKLTNESKPEPPRKPLLNPQPTDTTKDNKLLVVVLKHEFETCCVALNNEYTILLNL